MVAQNRVRKWNKSFLKINVKFATAVDPNKWPEQIKYPVLLYTRADLDQAAPALPSEPGS